MARDLLSKLLAAGLSAGVFLIWWPEHHPATGLTSLIVRGALWTLCFELLLVAFAPLERVGRRAVAGRMRSARVQDRLDAVPARARLGGACVLACVGAALPVTLLSGAHAPPPPRAAAPQRAIVVKRHVVRRVVVRQIVTVPAAAAHPETVIVTGAAQPAHAAEPARKRATAPAARTPPKATATPPATTTTPAAATTPPAPAPAEAAPPATG